VDDRRGLCRNRYCRNRLANFASARRRTGHGLVRILCRRAGVRDRVDLAHSDFAQSRSQRAATRISLAIIGFVYIGWMFGHLGFIANARNAYGFICYIIFATGLTDVAAFTFGRMFGHHPLRSEISPNKTWEGALGALGVAMILPWLLRFSFPFFGAWQLVLTGLIVGIGGQLGDLSISVIKRDIGTKDMAATIPGHGGILDRIDSLIYAAPLFMHMTGYYYPLR
jgi:phosphatidate cytidylyltransferase